MKMEKLLIKLIFTWVVFIIALACNTSVYKKNGSYIIEEEGNGTTQQEEIVKMDSLLVIENFFYEDSVLINGRVPLKTTCDFFVRTIGKPDSITDYKGEMYSAFEDSIEVETKSFYKYGSEYELYKNQLIYSEIFLNEKTFITYQDLILTNETSLEEFGKLFPLEVEQSGKIDIYQRGCRTMVRVKVFDREKVHKRINFIFKENCLESFHWWLP